jgi:hypothetical protein
MVSEATSSAQFGAFREEFVAQRSEFLPARFVSERQSQSKVFE